MKKKKARLKHQSVKAFIDAGADVNAELRKVETLAQTFAQYGNLEG